MRFFQKTNHQKMEEKILKLIDKYQSQINKYESNLKFSHNDVVYGLKMAVEEAVFDLKNIVANCRTK
jgi:hypothetical protein